MTATRVTYDVGHKIKAGGSHRKGFLRHLARDVDVRNGIVRDHGNKSIDPARTPNNMTLVPTGDGSGWRVPANLEEVEQRLTDRLATVTKPRRKDAVVMRGVVLGLSPEWIQENAPNWQTDRADQNKLAAPLLKLAEEVTAIVGGPANVVCASFHFDEEAPQLQVAVTPVTDDGRLAQKDFFNPISLKRQHRQLREALARAGYEVELKSSDRSKESLSNEEYITKRRNELEADLARLAEDRQLLDAERAELAAAREKLAAEQAQVDTEREAVAEARRQAVEDGKAEGIAQGLTEGRATGLAQGRAEGEREIEQAKQAALAAAKVDLERYRVAAREDADQDADAIVEAAQRQTAEINRAAREAKARAEAAEAEAAALLDSLRQVPPDFQHFVATSPTVGPAWEAYQRRLNVQARKREARERATRPRFPGVPRSPQQRDEGPSL